ncbi:hypothetical protein NDU88_003978 [Pleurodeles waltl]|uniref:Uncharacterized protein n=1 Tax=Pleurodeles waltl TaxID=8319 RepID=A0AAV7UFL4_PLEWA|nr:hypothetical protein NDU88_003978 [Pleurodeles waltl]
MNRCHGHWRSDTADRSTLSEHPTSTAAQDTAASSTLSEPPPAQPPRTPSPAARSVSPPPALQLRTPPPAARSVSPHQHRCPMSAASTAATEAAASTASSHATSCASGPTADMAAIPSGNSYEAGGQFQGPGQLPCCPTVSGVSDPLPQSLAGGSTLGTKPPPEPVENDIHYLCPWQDEALWAQSPLQNQWRLLST